VSSRLPQALWLLRHGESIGNVARDAAHAAGLERIAISAARDMDVPLSALGEVQAAAFGRWLAGQPRDQQPTAVLCSPYLRARRTAELAIAHAGLGHLTLTIDERLRERELGVLDRLTRLGIERQYPEQAELRRRLGKFFHRPPSGESWCDVVLRLRSVVDTICRELAGQRVLLVCHSAVVLCFRYLLEHLDEAQILAIDQQADLANCSLTTYALEGQRLALDHFNLVAPLQAQGVPTTAEPDVSSPPK
jgi:probable phosphoglycerate mutase